MPTRDPRVDPRPGDVLEKERVKRGGMLRRKVMDPRWRRAGIRFAEWLPGEKWGDYKGCDLANWRAWAKTATIITPTTPVETLSEEKPK